AAFHADQVESRAIGQTRGDVRFDVIEFLHPLAESVGSGLDFAGALFDRLFDVLLDGCGTRFQFRDRARVAAEGDIDRLGGDVADDLADQRADRAFDDALDFALGMRSPAVALADA